MKIQQRITKIVSAMLVAGLCVTPEMMTAQQQGSQAAQPQSQQAQQPQQQNDTQTEPANAQPQATSSQPQAKPGAGTSVDPSQAPLQPITTYPDASSQSQAEPEPQNGQTPQTVTTTEEAPDAPQAKKPSQPVGAAAAEKVPTAGGAASKPAGIAIAPAKQHQTRSLLLKIGAIAAAGIAVGTVYGLSRGTSSTPPNTTVAGATQK
jgi:cytoskeletal protein RodZ